ncbi:MAG TPA: ABC transporter substrate-binding protein [Lacipirellulaceae bacterium]|nr:ABC transporter substrate-binding protein [Lacipirellulaceae bacterium]
MTTTVARTLAVFFLASAALARGQDAPAARRPLIERTPFDVVVLNRANGGKAYEVSPLALPQRPLAAIPTEGTLVVRLLDRPLEEFEVLWANVAEVRVYEQMLFDEARKLTAAGKFDEAYDYFARLQADYPTYPGLRDAVSDYLRRNALALYQAKQHDRALALLVTLHEHNPTFAGFAGALETVAGEIIERYLREGNYSAARGVLEMWRRQFPGLAEEAVANWQRRFETAASRQLEEAERLIERKQYVAARRAVGRALGVWPQLQAANNLLDRIQREFPFIAVGVLETSPRQPTRRIDSWAALRASRLVERLIAEQVDFSPEGGVYRSPFGEWELDESGRELGLRLHSAAEAGQPTTSGLTPDNLSRFLLAMAAPGSPDYYADWGNLLHGVSIDPATSTVQAHLRRVHVRPEALLQVRPPLTSNAARYAIAEHGQEQVVFTVASTHSAQPGGIKAVVEQNMADDEAAVEALLAGDIDVLDRVPPWHVERLRKVEAVRVHSYRLPTVHVLIPNPQRPLLAKREFRRALCFGIDREWIVQRVLLAGAELPGFDVLSGPFPTGTSLSDPVRYAYNDQIAPRAFEPRLAAILSTVAWASVQNPSGDKEKEQSQPAEIPELVLAHPNDAIARVACQSIQAQLVRAGIPIKLQEFSADDLLTGRVECDLRYAELAVWEPVVDARRIMGPGGLVGERRSPYVDAALQRLDEATNWNDVRDRLAEMHEIAHHELPVIPLWQTVNFFAHRATLRGIGDSPVSLYQNIGGWSTATGGDVASATPAP